MKQKASTTQKRKRPSTTTPSSSKKKGRTSASDLVAQAIDHCNTEDYLKAKACYQNALAMDKNCLEAISGTCIFSYVITDHSFLPTKKTT